MRNSERIELHCHTKMGGNSLMYAGELMKCLSDRGSLAVAITDAASILAYPEMEGVWMTGKYKTRPIYGMEIPVTYHNLVVNCSVLIRNESGKKFIFSLMSNAGMDNNPAYELEDFINHRGDLLLGTGAGNGILYRVFEEGINQAQINEIMSLFDYIEVLPDDSLCETTKLIIESAKLLNKPVVAIGDAHYISEEDFCAWRILDAWKQNGLTDAKRHLYSTEDMLTAFSYLPEEEAQEIVINNTHMIAELCDEIQIIPKKKYYPIIDHVQERLKVLCEAQLHTHYSESVRKIAEKRLARELDALRKNGIDSFVLQLKEFFDKAALHACDVSCRGRWAGSLVTFLLGITEVDPIKNDLPFESVFGLDGMKEIDININIPQSIREQTVNRISELEGMSYAMLGSIWNSITPKLAMDIIEQYEALYDLSFEEKEREKICYKLVGNYTQRDLHPITVFLIPNDVNVEEITPVIDLGNGMKATYFQFYDVDGFLLKCDIMNNSSVEKLKRLSALTEINLSDVPCNDPEVIRLFTTCDSDGRLKCEQIAEFSNNEAVQIVNAIKPKDIDEIVKAFSLMCSTGAWVENAELLLMNQNVKVEEIISSREEIYNYLREFGFDNVFAYSTAEIVRKGLATRGGNAKWKVARKTLLAAGIPKWYIDSCEKIYYLFPKAHVISYVTMYMRLGWFLVHYPDEYATVKSEFEKTM